MIFWTREVAGWVLVGLGLFAFGVTYFQFLSKRQVFEAGPMAFIGFILFRGGLHLVKVAVAARICREAAEQQPARREQARLPVNGRR